MNQVALRDLEARFGRKAVSEWWSQAELVARMAFDSMVAISTAAEKPAAPESLAIVLRYVADTPEGLCATAAVSAKGPLLSDEKAALLRRALACLDETGDILVVRVAPGVVVPASEASKAPS